MHRPHLLLGSPDAARIDSIPQCAHRALPAHCSKVTREKLMAEGMNLLKENGAALVIEMKKMDVPELFPAPKCNWL